MDQYKNGFHDGYSKGFYDGLKQKEEETEQPTDSVVKFKNGKIVGGQNVR